MAPAYSFSGYQAVKEGYLTKEFLLVLQLYIAMQQFLCGICEECSAPILRNMVNKFLIVEKLYLMLKL